MIYTLQYVRFFASLSVVLHHFEFYFPGYGWGVFYYLGYFGVDVFFVVSGFVISRSLSLRFYGSSWKFLFRRFYRVYVSYIPFSILMVFAVYYYEARLVDVLGSLILIGFDYSGLSLPVAWTLQFELLFYFVIFCFLFFGFRYFILFYVFLCVSLFSFLLKFSGYYDSGFGSESFFTMYLFSFFWIQFLLGFFISHIRNFGFYFFFFGVMIFLFFLFSSFLYQLEFSVVLYKGSYVFERVLIGAGIGGSVVVMAIFLERFHRRSMEGFSRFLGGISYSVYLSHTVLMYVIFNVYGFNERYSYFEAFCFLLFGVILVSCLFYYLIERPLLAKADGLYKFVSGVLTRTGRGL